MAAIGAFPVSSHEAGRTVKSFVWCSCESSNNNNEKKKKGAPTPQFLKIAVSGVTEVLRLFSSRHRDRLDKVSEVHATELPVCGIDDVLMILKSDYEKAYFVKGVFTSAIYTEDCIFEDPTIKFRGCLTFGNQDGKVKGQERNGSNLGSLYQGKDLYSRNLKLLVPFFDHPSILLQKIEKGIDSEANFVLASWKLRTYLKLPWRPLIIIEGRTIYDLDDDLRITRHAESWNISALEAVGQIFTPSFTRPHE